MFKTIPGFEGSYGRTFMSYKYPVEKNNLMYVNLNTSAIIIVITIVGNAFVKAIISHANGVYYSISMYW